MDVGKRFRAFYGIHVWASNWDHSWWKTADENCSAHTVGVKSLVVFGGISSSW